MPSSFRCAPSAFHLQCGSEAGQPRRRRARPWRDESIRIGLRTLILTLLEVLTIAALLHAARSAHGFLELGLASQEAEGF